MDVKILNKQLRNEAIRLGLCNEWQQMWNKDWDIQKMIDRYKTGIDFCMENHYPNMDYIKANFNKKLLRQNDILADDSHSLLNPKVAVVIGSSKATIRYNAWSSGEIRIGDTSDVLVYAKNMSFVMVHLYDNASVSATASDKARIVVVKHGESANVKISSGDVRIKIPEN